VSSATESLSPDAIAALLPALAALLVDAVDGGASLGFLPPLADGAAREYWREVAGAVSGGTRVLVVARDGAGGVVGAAQLDLATRANASHRAEVAKVMVDRRVRRQGIGRALMIALEAHARRLGRTTLVLDTRAGDPSEALYRTLGWQRAGTIPRYARSADGTLDATAIYYKLLEPPGAA
jgi:ribosomal protein S18 acetylase RimI-like enzyme